MKRRRVNDRVVIPLAVVAGIIAALSGASPTATTWTDGIIVIASVALVTWAGASTPWWAGAAFAGIAAATAGTVPLTVIGLAAFAAALWVGLQRRDVPLMRAAVAGVALNVLIRSDLDGFLGLSALIGVAASIAILIIGVTRRRSGVRRRVWWGLGAIGVFAVLALAGAGVAAATSRSDLTDGNRTARAALSLLNDGDYVRAAASFDEAADSFDGADAALTAPWAIPARLVPGVSQNLSAARDLADAAAVASADLSLALGVVDPEQLRLVNGRFDVDAVRLIQQPFHSVQASIAELDAAIDDASSPWLISPLDARMRDLHDELADNGTRLDNAVLAVDLAPQLLGEDGRRRYFIAFTTPAEARGQGGFMGNWAEITADDGRLSLSRSGRTRDLNVGGDGPRTVTGPADWVEQWGRYGFTSGPGGATEPAPWSNVTVSPQFPSTAQVIAELYPQSGGRQLDGVFAMDPYVLQALLGMTGPISIDGTDTKLSQGNVIDFLLVDQYEVDDSPTRVDLLDEVARTTMEQVLSGALPNPTVVARELGPLAAQGRLAGWARDADEQALFERVSLAAALPILDGGDGYAVVLNNAGANKLDVYLERNIAYEAVVDSTGVVDAIMTVTLTNTVPDTDLPEAVTGNYTGDDRGTNRTLLSLYSPLAVIDATVTDASGKESAARFVSGVEAGWNVNTVTLFVPPGVSITLRTHLTGAVESPGEYTLAVRPLPLVVPEHHRIDVSTVDGRNLVTFEGVIDNARAYPISRDATG